MPFVGATLHDLSIGRADVVGAHDTHHGPSMAGGLGGSSSTCTYRFGPRARWACDSLNRGIPPLENLLVESPGILSQHLSQVVRLGGSPSSPSSDIYALLLFLADNEREG
jgi:hypothetical protein